MNNDKIEINRCGCGGEVTLHTDEEFRHYRDFYYCECDNCSTKTSKYDEKEYTIEQWNTAHPKTSKVMQAYEWLKSGEIIMLEGGEKYRLCDGMLQRFSNNEVWIDYNISLVKLFESDWKLYRGYNFVDYGLAINAFLEGKKVCLVFIEDEECRVLHITENYVLFEDQEGKTFKDDRESFLLRSRLDWRVYE